MKVRCPQCKKNVEWIKCQSREPHSDFWEIEKAWYPLAADYPGFNDIWHCRVNSGDYFEVCIECGLTVS
jgi:hypothetical protein